LIRYEIRIRETKFKVQLVLATLASLSRGLQPLLLLHHQLAPLLFLPRFLQQVRKAQPNRHLHQQHLFLAPSAISDALRDDRHVWMTSHGAFVVRMAVRLSKRRQWEEQANRQLVQNGSRSFCQAS